MNKYYCSYTGCVVIFAETPEEAQEKFDNLTPSQLIDNLEEHRCIEFKDTLPE